MKKALLISLCALSLQSCSVVFPVAKIQIDKQQGKTEQSQSHGSFMDEFSTKQEIIREWGLPSSRETIEGIEIWYYSLGSTSRGYSAGSVNTDGRISSGSTINSYDKYVEFQFQEDKVVNWRTQGVNYGYEPMPKWIGPYFVGILIDSILLSIWLISLE